MKETNIRARSKSGNKTGVAQPRKTRNPNPATTEASSLPKWLDIPNLALLEVLAANRTKYNLNTKAITHLVERFHLALTLAEVKQRLKAMAAHPETIVPVIGKSGLWQITGHGLTMLEIIHNDAAVMAIKPNDSVEELVRKINELPPKERRSAEAMIARLYKKSRAASAAACGGAR